MSSATRSAVIARSSSAMAPRMCSMNRPTGPDVSMLSRSETNLTPCASNRRISSSRSASERLIWSSFVTMTDRTRPASTSAMSSWSLGRSVSLAETPASG